jgi:hypothetical protein
MKKYKQDLEAREEAVARGGAGATGTAVAWDFHASLGEVKEG